MADTSTNRANFAEQLPTIPELTGSVNTRAFLGTNPTSELITVFLYVGGFAPPVEVVNLQGRSTSKEAG